MQAARVRFFEHHENVSSKGDWCLFERHPLKKSGTVIVTYEIESYSPNKTVVSGIKPRQK
jgi:hypothetical protein